MSSPRACRPVPGSGGRPGPAPRATQAQYFEARHRTQARVEARIRCAKATGPRHLPSRNYQVNTAWCQATSIACDLLAPLRLLALDGDLATAERVAG
jgi:hypothetical protein